MSYGDPDDAADGVPTAAGRVVDNVWSAQITALGGFIRAQRQLAKLSLREMAAMTSVSNAYLSQIERGLHQPSLKVLHSIADALQLSIEQLLKQGGWASGPAAEGSAGSASAGWAGGGSAGAGSASPGSAGAESAATEEAIRADPRLSTEQRAALLGVYQSFVDGVESS